MYSCEKNGADSVSEKMVQQTLLGDLEWKNPIEMVDIELFEEYISLLRREILKRM